MAPPKMHQRRQVGKTASGGVYLRLSSSSVYLSAFLLVSIYTLLSTCYNRCFPREYAMCPLLPIIGPRNLTFRPRVYAIGMLGKT